MSDEVVKRFRACAPAADHWTLRVVRSRSRRLAVRQDVLEPLHNEHDLGAMVTVTRGDGWGYAATDDLSASGLDAAGRAALRWAEASRSRSASMPPPPARSCGRYASPVGSPALDGGLAGTLDRLRGWCRRMDRGARITDRQAALWCGESETRLVSSDGGDIEQRYAMVSPWLAATANRGGESQTRSFGRDSGRQGGLEQLDDLEVDSVPERLADEALSLLDAPDCPAGVRDVVLLPSQMVLQIHESIGHPLELDRILGDERNYAGTSFVTPEMFGSYRYGSALLNIANDPQRAGEFASCAFDDEGTPAARHLLIAEGVLLRGLGGALSQRRSGLPGSSSTRACSWNRPPIDRMANLNLLPGESSLEQLIAGVERGIMMDTNRSWSIDDSRNKFQFGCEYARLIEDGRLAGVVRNANYRGISASFWRNLTGVGAEVQVAGTPNCGKGEPNQIIHVGHATPACRFAGVDVFGGRLMGMLRAAWEELADGLVGMLHPGEHCLLGFSGEESDFVRLNHARIRQAGRVVQGALTIELIAGRCHASTSCRLGPGREEDRAFLAGLLGELRAQLAVVGEDPHLLYCTSPSGSVREDRSCLPDSAEALSVMTAAGDLDLVGVWAAGTIQRGFASSFGQRSWHSVHTFNASWSCHLQGDRSVSGAYAGTAFAAGELAARLQVSRSELDGLRRPAAAVPPGRYRAYLAPAAVRELLGMLGWGGFSLKAHRAGASPLLRLAQGEARLDARVALSEERSSGLVPRFTASGFSTPGRVPLISAGAIDQLLISPRSAREYALEPNAEDESPHSLVLAAGELPSADVLRRLGRGLWIGNLWYCNYSDPNACRITGLTRFACWWVEDGEIRAPLPVMRFDDSIYGLLGSRLLGITAEREHLHSASTYVERALESMLVPGLLVEDLELTL